MAKLPKALESWPSKEFGQTLKHEIMALEQGALPLAKATSQGGVIAEGSISVTVLSVTDEPQKIKAVLGVFFTEIVGGCSCGDDPLEDNGHCEMSVAIDKSTAEAEFTLL